MPEPTSPYRPVAESAARAAGALLRDHFGGDQDVDAFEAHDIKLALDVRSQELITEQLLGAFPDHMVAGEEGDTGDPGAELQWVVDPIDGTVNFFYGLPHFCTSIALRRGGAGGEILLGVIYDPLLDELWAAEPGAGATLNGKPIRVSPRRQLGDAVVTVGFSKSKEAMDAGFARFRDLAYRVRKTRMLGSAALALTYIASGRLDAYIEEVISWWDIAAGKLIVEEAGGRVEIADSPVAPGKLSICAWNGALPLAGTLAG